MCIRDRVITPTQLGEMIFGVVHGSIKSLLNPELTASWELGLTQVAEGKITADEYMDCLLYTSLLDLPQLTLVWRI